MGLPDWRPNASVESLTLRANLIRNIREWFYQHNILEVETPLLSVGATTDPQIESFAVDKRQLRTSAEFHHKRLLASGYPDIYELGKVFRVDESGRYHNPEFTMLEWYRRGLDHHQLISEIELLLQSLHSDASLRLGRISYRDLWIREAGIDLAQSDCKDITTYLQQAGVAVPEVVLDQFEILQDLALGTALADALPDNQYTCVYDYPASKASLARIDQSDPQWHTASRFEIYYGSTELANGFHELTDAAEQLARFESDNLCRSNNQQKNMPIDMSLIAALEHGLPDCAGVAIGIDRLMMVLMEDVDHLQNTLSFNWHRA